ncbi:MAG: hypothetical protein ACXVLO_09365 [Acidimicrobiia bacterium]
MQRRPLFATIATVVFSAAALTAAVGATTHVFTTADASTGVGTVSPVSSPPAPVVEKHVIDVVDPVPAGDNAPTAITTGPAPAARPRPTPTTSPPTVTAAAPAPTATVATPAPAPTREHAEPGDD